MMLMPKILLMVVMTTTQEMSMMTEMTIAIDMTKENDDTDDTDYEDVEVEDNCNYDYEAGGHDVDYENKHYDEDDNNVEGGRLLK